MNTIYSNNTTLPLFLRTKFSARSWNFRSFIYSITANLRYSLSWQVCTEGSVVADPDLIWRQIRPNPDPVWSSCLFGRGSKSDPIMWIRILSDPRTYLASGPNPTQQCGSGSCLILVPIWPGPNPTLIHTVQAFITKRLYQCFTHKKERQFRQNYII